tara:strand:+ start:1997 stop:2587 length:591 start_codon:yes stop_codon:yes gene_type:complete
MKLSKYLVVLLILLHPSSNACHRYSQSNVVVHDCKEKIEDGLIQGTPNIRMSASNCQDYLFKCDVVKQALDVFVNEYSEEFRIEKSKVWFLLKDLKIEFSAIPKTVNAAYDINGELLTGEVPVSGLAMNKDLIWVEIRTSQIWSSSLIHEIVHVIIWRKNIVHGDPDHEGPDFSGWTKEHTKLIKRVNKILLNAEI